MVTKPAQEGVAAFFAPKLKPNPAAPKQPADSSTIMIIDSGSELSEIDSADPVDGLKPAKTARTRSKPKTAHAKPKPAETASGKGAPKKVVKGAKTGKSDKGQGTPKQGMKEDKGKGKAKVDGGEVVKKPRAKPVRKPEVPVEPPAFEKVDTRLGKEEAEQRIAVRPLRWARSALTAISYGSTSLVSGRCCQCLNGLLVHLTTSTAFSARRPYDFLLVRCWTSYGKSWKSTVARKR